MCSLMSPWIHSLSSGWNRQTHREKMLPPSSTHPPSPPPPDMWATSCWLIQANSAVQDGRGRKRMEEGRNEAWLLSWYELCPRDSPKQWALTAQVEIPPQTVLTWCECERGGSSDLAAETRWSKPQMESVEQSRSRKNRGYVSPHTQEVLCCGVWLRKRGCWCVQVQQRRGWHWGLSKLAEDLPNHTWWMGALTWRPGRGFSLTRAPEWIEVNRVLALLAECTYHWKSQIKGVVQFIWNKQKKVLTGINFYKWLKYPCRWPCQGLNYKDFSLVWGV